MLDEDLMNAQKHWLIDNFLEEFELSTTVHFWCQEPLEIGSCVAHVAHENRTMKRYKLS